MAAILIHVSIVHTNSCMCQCRYSPFCRLLVPFDRDLMLVEWEIWKNLEGTHVSFLFHKKEEYKWRS